MKIKTQEDLKVLDTKIKEELGIDIQNYKNEEVVNNLVELFVFPQYVIKWVLRPILIALLLFLLGFYILNLVHIEYFIYTLLGFVLFSVNGLITGLLFLIKKMKKDLWSVANYSLELMKQMLTDIGQINGKLTKENQKEVLGLLFKGVIHLLTIPVLASVITNKVPFVSQFVNRLVKKVLTLLSNQLKFDEVNFKQSIREEEIGIIQNYTISLETASNGLEKGIDITFKIAQFPLKLIFVILFILLLLFIYLIH